MGSSTVPLKLLGTSCHMKPGNEPNLEEAGLGESPESVTPILFFYLSHFQSGFPSFAAERILHTVAHPVSYILMLPTDSFTY